MEDEFLDLVDDNDVVIGRKLRSEVYAEGLSNFRVVNVFIINSKGELWVPRRTASKKIFPLCLDASMGGHVESGETYENALRREIREELNIDLDAIKYVLLGNLNKRESGVSCFMKVYEIKMDEAPEYNEIDFIEYFWLKPEEVLRLIDGGEKSKSDLPKMIREFYGDGK
jgi:isopentenyl-diphosphate delta-isomerase